MKLTKNIDLREIVYPAIWNQYAGKCMWFIDPRVVDITQSLCDDLAKHHNSDISVRLNNWHSGGTFTQKGLRPFDSNTGSALSQHKFGRAADPEFILKSTGKEIPPDDVRKFILDNEKDYMSLGLTTLEDGAYAPGWCHFDCRWTGLDHILIVKPK